MPKVANVIIRVQAQDQVTAPLARIAASFSGLNKNLGGMNTAFGGLSRVLLDVANTFIILESGVRIVKGAFDAVIDTVSILTDEIGRAVQASAEFEYALAGVTSRTDAFNNTELADELKQTAIHLAQISKFNPTEVVDGMRTFAMAGLETNEIIAAMPEAVKLAAASNTDLALSTDILTTAAATLGLKYTELGGLADKLTAATLGAKVELGQFQEGFKFIGPQAKAFGMGIEQSAAALAVLNERGLKSGLAGRGIRSMLTSLIDPSKTAKGLMDELGITIDDGTGNLKDMTTIVKDFKKALSGLTEVQAQEYLAGIFTQQGMTAMSILISGQDKYNKLLKEMGASAGLSERIMDQFLNTLKGRWEQLQETIYGVRVQIGDKFNPILKDMVETFTSFLTQYTPQILKFFSIFADLLRETWGFAKRVGEAFRDKGLTAGFAELRKGLSSFVKQLEIIEKDWQEWWNKLQADPEFQLLKSEIEKGLAGIGTAIGKKLKEWGATFWAWIDKKIKPETPGVFMSLTHVMLDALGKLIEGVAGLMSTLSVKFWDWITGADGAKAQIPTVFQGLFTSIGNAIGNNWGIVTAVLGKLLFGWWGFFIGAILPGVGPNMGELISRIANYLRENWPTIEEKLKEWGTQFWNWLTLDVLPAAQVEISGLIDEIGRIISEDWPKIQAKLAEWTTQFWVWLEQLISETPTKINELIVAIGDALSGDVLSAHVDFGSWLTDFWTNLIPQTFEVGSAMVRFTQAVEDWAKQPDTQSAFAEIGQGLAANLAVGVNNFFQSGGGLIGVGTVIGTTLAMAVENIKETIWAIGASIAAGMVTGFIESLTGTDISDEFVKDIATKFQGMAQSILEAMAPVPVLILEGVEALITLLGKLDELQTKLENLGFASIFGEDYEQSISAGTEKLIEVLGLSDKLKEWGAGMGDKIPWWLRPGSPTPFELGLEGINNTLINMKPITEVFSVPAAEQTVSLGTAAQNFGLTLMNIVGPALDNVMAKTRMLYNLFVQMRNITNEWSRSLGTLVQAIGRVESAMKKLNDTMKNFKPPSELTPGSPTPFELGLRGIANAIQGMPEMGFAGTPAMGGGITNYYITVGGVSSTVTGGTTGGDGADEAIRMTVEVLRQSLARI